MNEQLQNTVNEILQKAISAAMAGADFLANQIPDVLQQLLLWNLSQNLALGAIFATSAGTILTFLYKDVKKCWSDRLTDEVGAFLIAVFGGMAPMAASCLCFLNALKIWIAPKVWLLEYAASLVKHS